MLRASVDRYFQRAGSPSTTVSPVRQCADVWPKTTSRPGATTCGAFRRSMGSTLPAWRTCSTSMPKRPIRSARSEAPGGLFRREPNPAHRRGPPADPGPSGANSNATTASISAMGRQTCGSRRRQRPAALRLMNLLDGPGVASPVGALFSWEYPIARRNSRSCGWNGVDHKIACLGCGGPLSGRKGAFILKYFLVNRPE